MKIKAKQLLLTFALTLVASTTAWGQDPIVDYTYLPPEGGGSPITTSVNLAQQAIDPERMNYARTIRLTGNWSNANLVALKTALKPGGSIDATNGSLISADLAAVTLTGTITDCFYGLFANCPNLVWVTLPAAGTGQQVTFARLFQGCGSLASIANLEKYTCVSSFEYFMAGCRNENMNYVTLPAGTAYAGGISFAHAFEGCEWLWGITNLEKFTRASSFEYAFAGCMGLGGITLPARALYQGDVSFAHAFDECGGLASIVNLEKFTRVSSFENAFSSCYALTDVTLPAGSSAAGGISFVNAFRGCERLTSIANLDKYPQASSFAGAFYRCTALQRITLPASSTYAGAVSFEGAFYQCSALTEVAHLDKFRTASSFRNAFYECTALRHVSLPASPANTQDVSFYQAFYGCTALRSVANLEGFTRLGSFFYAFRDCRNLTYVKFGAFPSGEESGAPPANSTFRNVNTNCLVYLPPNTAEADIPADWGWNAVNFIFVQKAGSSGILIDRCVPRRDMTLNGDAPFYCPESIESRKGVASYTRDFGTEPSGIGGKAAGWETICLPFDVTEIVAVNAAGDSVRLQPFRADGTYEGQGTPGVVPFWLRRLTPEGYVPAEKIESSRPYIIALPNNEAYEAKFNVTGKVTFRNPIIETGGPVVINRHFLSQIYYGDDTAPGSAYTMHTAFDFVGTSPSVYVINPAGTAFVANSGEARPFRPYVVANNPQNAPAQFVIGEEGGEPTAIEVAVLMGHAGSGADGADGLRVYGSTERGALVVEVVASAGAAPSTVDVVAIDGRVVRTVSLHEGVNVVDGLAAGVYVVGGCKAVVR